MKIIKWFAGLLVAITLIVLISFLQYEPSSKDEPAKFNSGDIESSKKQGYFKAEYKPLQDKIKLMHYADSIEFKSLWFEIERVQQFVGTVGKNAYTAPIASDSLYFQIDFIECCSNDYIFEIAGHGSRYGRGTFDSTILPDTISFSIIERNPDKLKGWKEYLNGQEISFVKLKQ